MHMDQSASKSVQCLFSQIKQLSLSTFDDCVIGKLTTNHVPVVVPLP